MIDKSINSGPDAHNGFALQRNTAIYLLLDNYISKFKDKDYFVCLEHHDDFLFCFLNEKEEVDLIEAYQSKKKSPSIWRANPELFEILNKLLKTGKNLISDKILKSDQYKHILYFSTNQTIEIKKKYPKKDNKKDIIVSIKNDNPSVQFGNLHTDIQEHFKTNIIETTLHDQFDKLNFLWIPFTTTAKEQENQLEGKISEVFGNKIFDKRAAIDSLISLFRKIEGIYNHGNEVQLLDKTKRVESDKIEKALKVLTTKAKCFDYWHLRKTEISLKLQIKPIEKEIFELAFDSAFDLFKSIQEAEHQKILQFTKEQIGNVTTFSEEENVMELFDLFQSTCTTNFNELQIKAILFASLFEVLYIKEK
ncbi:hypothetical protein ABXT06_17505 [Flavobacterium sp. UW10123]|uniref:hypothetical protein n=1 Tax=Flavobacterium sp. UW10123 TaxID=3230800 RepID=UPI0033922D2E